MQMEHMIVIKSQGLELTVPITMPSTPSSSSDYMTGEADDSSDSKAVIPFSLKSVETVLSLSKV